MIDFETLSVSDNALVVQIGAVYFDPETGSLGKMYEATIDPQDAQSNGAVIDASTVAWWLSQSKDAQNQVFKPGESEQSAFIGLHVFLNKAKRIWSKPSTFDWRILDQTFKRLQLGVLDHRTPRDMRTLMDYYPGELPKFKGTPHVALHDAIYQAECVSLAVKHIKGIK